MKLSIIIPAYNEARTIREVLTSLAAVRFPVDYELILVDDASVDRTREILTQLCESRKQTRLFTNTENLGKGSSVRRGLAEALGDIVIVQDGDLELDPRDIPALIRPILEGRADAVYGSRFLRSRWPEKMAFQNWVANRILNMAVNLLYRAQLTDVSCGYKAVRANLLRSLSLRCRRFEFCFEVTAKLKNRGVRIEEVPISFEARTRKEGKKIRHKDFFIALWTLLRYRFGGEAPPHIKI
jgi:glycosyltransferase involved in cell wall biosynthesis